MLIYTVSFKKKKINKIKEQIDVVRRNDNNFFIIVYLKKKLYIIVKLITNNIPNIRILKFSVFFFFFIFEHFLGTRVWYTHTHNNITAPNTTIITVFTRKFRPIARNAASDPISGVRPYKIRVMDRFERARTRKLYRGNVIRTGSVNYRLDTPDSLETIDIL